MAVITAVIVGASFIAGGNRGSNPQDLTTQPAASATSLPGLSTKEVRFVTASSLNVRAAPSPDGSIVGKVQEGLHLEVLDKSDGWLLIRSANAQGWVSEKFTATSSPALDSTAVTSGSQSSSETGIGARIRFSMCGRSRNNCVVDGDTVWLDGVNLRLQSYDTPEAHNDICGGTAEIELAGRASARLLDLLNSNPITVETASQDRYGRTLATILINGKDVGDTLIAEGLARRWPDGDEWWCRQ